METQEIPPFVGDSALDDVYQSDEDAIPAVPLVALTNTNLTNTTTTTSTTTVTNGTTGTNETKSSRRFRFHHHSHHKNKTASGNATNVDAWEDEEEMTSPEHVDDDDSYDYSDLTANVVEDRWTPQPLWSIAPTNGESSPNLVSDDCYRGLVSFFSPTRLEHVTLPSGANTTRVVPDPWLAAARLSVATEASSHPTGVRSLQAQPWVYAGGGLGNVDECLSLNDRTSPDHPSTQTPLVHVCLAGGTAKDSLTFASACVVASCSAQDVLADDFPERVATAGASAYRIPLSDKTADQIKYEVDYDELLHEYVTLHKRIARVGEYLRTGWVCGEYSVDWEPVPSRLWCGAMLLCLICTLVGTAKRQKSNHRNQDATRQPPPLANGGDPSSYNNSNDHRNKNMASPISTSSSKASSTSLCYSSSSSPESTAKWSAPSSSSSSENHVPIQKNADIDNAAAADASWFWKAWDVSSHLERLTHRRADTACLDGLRVGSILWVIGAHIMAIQSSTAAGYLNPKDFFPPKGVTTTLFGQLLFSSRFAVDTFLCVSGYLAARVLSRKLPANKGIYQTLLSIGGAIFLRILRILPLYGCCLGFWMFLAPHMGSGPFWYQWEHFLEPCRQYWWTNLLFVNNFWPWGSPTEATCFYHSWYLAVDVQLFCLLAPWLVVLSQKGSAALARRATVGLWLASVVVTVVLAYANDWSVNSFDGISVALFDVEAYAKPHVRAQSYLAGILVAFWPKQRYLRGRPHRNWPMLLAVAGLAVLSFVTVTGAYARRACTFEESPLGGDDCGSVWSPTANFVYTAFSRAAWSVCIAVLLHLCLRSSSSEDETYNDGKEHAERNHVYAPSSVSSGSGTSWSTRIVQKILGWSLWTPLAHLSFGAYLIHPIVIYVWFLGGREKITFRLFTYMMEFCSITVVTFVASFAVTILVEFPLGILLRPPSSGGTGRRKLPAGTESDHNHQRDPEMASLLFQSALAPSSLPFSGSQSYGSLQQKTQ